MPAVRDKPMEIDKPVSAAELRRAVADVLAFAGMEPDAARAMAEILVFAQESGIDSHGVAHLPAYVAGIASGAVNARPQLRIDSIRRTAAVIDADRAPGALAGLRACEEAIERARECGIAIVAVRNSGHFGAASAFVDRIARAGMIGLVFSNASPTVAPRGGATPIFGTNPIGAGFPRAGADPVIIDFATTSGSRGKIRQAAARGDAIPPDWALDKDGQPTTDAKAALSGTMQALGGAKGVVLPMLVEMLCVSLSGGGPGSSVLTPQDPSAGARGVSHLFIAIDAHAFGGIDGVGARVDAISRSVEQSVAVDDATPPRLPGSRGAARRDMSSKTGMILNPAVKNALDEARSIAHRIRDHSVLVKVS